MVAAAYTTSLQQEYVLSHLMISRLVYSVYSHLPGDLLGFSNKDMQKSTPEHTTMKQMGYRSRRPQWMNRKVRLQLAQAHQS